MLIPAYLLGKGNKRKWHLKVRRGIKKEIPRNLRFRGIILKGVLDYLLLTTTRAWYVFPF